MAKHLSFQSLKMPCNDHSRGFLHSFILIINILLFVTWYCKSPSSIKTTLHFIAQYNI